MAYPADFITIQRNVLAKLRYTGSDTSPDGTNTYTTLVKDAINHAYAEAAMETQCLQQAGYGTLTAGSPTYTIPNTVLEMKKVIIQGVSDQNYGPPLQQATLDQILSWRQSSGGTNPMTGIATHYAVVGLDQLELWPTPSSADTIQFYYSYLPTALSGDTDVPEFGEPWSRLLEYGALAFLADLGPDQMGPAWEQKYQDLKARLRIHMNRRGGMVGYFPMTQRVPVAHDPSTDIGF